MINNIKISIIMPVYNVQDYLEEALQSIQNQTFDDYEVLMVDDGSTDASLEIMKKYSQLDTRFISYSKENKGVSQARNYALDRAHGEYVAFLDGDDLMPKRALEAMYRTAKEHKAEIIIGKMQEFSLAKKSIYQHTKNLSVKKQIDKYDEDILWTMMLGNKLYSRNLIEENKIRFESVKFSEDAIFTMSCIFKSKMICGCSKITNQYRKRFCWEGRSVTQMISRELFEDFLYSYEKVITLAKDSLSRDMEEIADFNSGLGLQLQYKKISYVSAIYEKLVKSILDQFYRQIWKENENVFKLIAEKIQEYKQYIIPEKWDNLVSGLPELRLNRPLLKAEQLAKQPLISIVITENLKFRELEIMMDSIYNQLFPAFEVLIQKSRTKNLNIFYKEKCNLRLLEAKTATEAKNEAVKKARGTAIIFIDHLALFEKNTLNKMYKAIMSSDIDMVVMKMKHLGENEVISIDTQEVVNVLRYRQPLKKKTTYNKLDNTISNKLIKKNVLKSHNFLFTDKPWKDSKKLYREFQFKKIIDNPIITNLTDRDFLKHIFIFSPVRFSYKFKYNSEFKRTKLYQKQCLENRIKMKQKRKKQFFAFLKAVLPVFNRVFFYSIRNDGALLENSAAVYNALPDVKKVIFASRLPHTKKEKIGMYFKLLTSRVIVTDDYCKYLREVELRPKQKVVQIWHACGAFKKFSLDYPSSDRFTEKLTHYQYDTVIVSSENVKKYYAGAFGIPIDRIKALGVPRTDNLLDQINNKNDKEQFFRKFSELKGKKIIIFCPTFREVNNKQVKYKTGINWRELNNSLQDDEVLLIKKHPIMKYDLLEGKKYSKIKNMNEVSTYTLMNVSKLMITDYSSVIFEYALYNKPVIFYCPDFYDYERDFYLKFPQELFGDFVTDPSLLTETIHQALKGNQIPGIEEFKEKMMGSCDGHSAERVARLIKSYLK